MADSAGFVELPDGRALRVLGAVQRLEYAPGDTLVVMWPMRLHVEQIQRFRDELHVSFPGARVLVLCDGASVGVLSPQAMAVAIDAGGSHAG